jgi:hypothetical protein
MPVGIWRLLLHGDLAALVRRLEAAHEPSPYLDAALLAAFSISDRGLQPTHSIADACRLTDRIMPGLLWSISGLVGEAKARLVVFEGLPRAYVGTASTPALALLAAFVKLLVDQPDIASRFP